MKKKVKKITFKKAETLEASIHSTDLSQTFKEDKLTSISPSSSELLTYLTKDLDKNIATINYLINSGISKDKNFQKDVMDLAQNSVIFEPLTKYCMDHKSEDSTKILYELTFVSKDKEKTREITDHLLKPENFEQTFSMIEGFPMCNLILSASSEIQDQVIDKLMRDKDKDKAQEILSELSKNENVSKEKRADIIREVCIKPKLTKLLQNASDAGSITEKDRAEFDAIKKDTIRLGEVLGDKEKAVFTKHIGGIIREIALEKGIKLNMRVKTIQILSDRAHSLGYKKQERDLVKKMMGLSNPETPNPLPSADRKRSGGRIMF